MDSNNKMDSLLAWLFSFENFESPDITDGAFMLELLTEALPTSFLAADESASSVIAHHALHRVATALERFYATDLPELRAEPLGDAGLERMLTLVLGCVVQSDGKEKYIGQIMGLEEDVQR